MEGPFRLLLLALLLPAAAATALLGRSRASRPCWPPRSPASVQRASPPCSAVNRWWPPSTSGAASAAEPKLVAAGLNATDFLMVYTSCGGLLRPGRAQLAACQGPAPPATLARTLPHAAATT
ncbi:uncharacterized protein LOC119352517 [Triticum dicoccoides]|uniref:uncharacterized protein LOC119352517 n=1 Tax=Triticum dicoccoides TaxID=85692 RepID=UPI00188F849D|nr:uncharacterized protein LOC119352517 [Triticum dicoccoides]